MAISSPPRPSGQAAPHSQRGLITALVLGLVALLILVLVLAALLVGRWLASSAVQGSGVAATQPRAVAAFGGIDLAGSNNVTVVVGGRQSVVVHADSNLLGNVTTRVVAGTLIIDTTGSFTTKSPMSVAVSVPSLTAVTLSGSGQISITGIDAPRLAVSLPGSGVIYAGGTVTQLDVTLAGSGLAQFTNLVARDVHAVVTGSGLIGVTATARLNAAVSGSGAIIYSGKPRVTKSITGSGIVTGG